MKKKYNTQHTYQYATQKNKDCTLSHRLAHSALQGLAAMGQVQQSSSAYTLSDNPGPLLAKILVFLSFVLLVVYIAIFLLLLFPSLSPISIQVFSKGGG